MNIKCFCIFVAINLYYNFHLEPLMKSLVFFIFILLCFACSKAPEEVKIVFFTDVHVAPGSENDTLLQKAIEEVNAENYDFVIFTGDLTTQGRDDELNRVHDIISKLNKPVYVIPGNHETNWSESACHTFNNLWKDDRFVVEKKGYLFLGYNTGPYLKMGDGLVKPEDIRWMDKILKNQAANVRVVSLCHYPLGDGLGNWAEVTDLLKKYDVILAACGHGHQLRMYNFDSIPGIMGRALVAGSSKNKTTGYNILRLANDSVYVAEKQIAKPAKWKYAFKQRFSEQIGQLESTPRPAVTDFEKFSNIHLVLQDTAAIFTGVAISPANILYYGNSLGNLIAYDYKQNKVNWVKNLDGAIYSTPICAGNIVVCGSSKGYIIGLNALTGKELWRIKTKAPVVGDGLIKNSYLYMGGGTEDFFKIDAKTGKIIWTYSGVKSSFQGAPVIFEDKVLFGAWDRSLYCLNEGNGKLCWRWDNGHPQRLFSPGNVVPFVAQEKVFLVAPDRYMTALELKSGKQLWRTNKYKVRESMGGNHTGNMIFAKTMDGEVVAVSTKVKEYKDLWISDLGFGYDHNPCPLLEYKDTLYCSSRQGDFAAINTAKKGQLLWKTKLGYSSINKICTDNEGNKWCTLIEGKIFKIE